MLCITNSGRADCLHTMGQHAYGAAGAAAPTAFSCDAVLCEVCGDSTAVMLVLTHDGLKQTAAAAESWMSKPWHWLARLAGASAKASTALPALTCTDRSALAQCHVPLLQFLCVCLDPLARGTSLVLWQERRRLRHGFCVFVWHAHTCTACTSARCHRHHGGF
jgi:hypothetical protein